jgi:hypothetical protein
MGIGTVVDTGVRLWLRNWGRLALISLSLSGIALVAAEAAGVMSLSEFIRWFEEGADPDLMPRSSTLANAILQAHSWVLTPMLLVGMARIALGAAASASPELLKALHTSLVRLPQSLWLLLAEVILFLGVVLAAGIALLIGIAAGGVAGLIIVGVPAFLIFFVIAMRLSLGTPALVLEDYRGFKALGYAWRLTKGKAWRTIAVLLLAGVISFGGAVVGLLIELLVPGYSTGADMARALIQAITTAAIGPLGACITSVLYLDLLARSRGHLETGEVRSWLASRDPS